LLRRLQANAEYQGRLLADLAILTRNAVSSRRGAEFSLVELVRDIVDEVQAGADPRPVEIVVRGTVPSLRGDPDRLRLVLGQLIANAVAFMGDQPAPRIEIGAEERDGVVEFSVSDNGIGIDAAYHGKIFEPFERLRGDGPGTGAGLTIVEKIVREDGGRVWVESAPGQGSTFRFTVPCGREAAVGAR
jgi:signal transduction histidine kinase